MILIASASLACVVALIALRIAAPLPRLAKKIAPYDTVARVRLGGTVNNDGPIVRNSSFFVVEFLRPMYEACIKAITKIAALDDQDAAALKLEQAGLSVSVDAYRMTVVKNVAGCVALGFILGAGLGNAAAMLTFPVLFGFIGFTKSRAKIDNLIEKRCARMRSEIYTIDQLLALHVKTGAGVTQALTSVASRTSGIISEEIGVILSRVRSGMPIEESLYIASRTTPEPHVIRTYKLLAAASQRGVDLTQGLLDLAKDIRRSLREEIKATGAKRRAAMLLPTIGILAPIMLIFVAAPIPSIVLGGR